MNPDASVAQILTEAYGIRRERNPRYTLRAFARDLGLSSGRLSNILQERQGLSSEGAQKIALRLGLSAAETERFKLLADSRWGRSKALRKNATQKLIQSDIKKPLDAEAFKVISQWYHLALLEMLKTDTYASQPAALAKHLGISAPELKLAVQRLTELGLVKRQGNRLRCTDNVFVNPAGTPSMAVRSFHEQILQRGLRSIQEQSPLERDLSSLLLAFNPEDVDEARDFIRDFRKRFHTRFRDRAKPRHVYSLAIQFFRLNEQVIEKGQSHDLPQAVAP